MTVNSVFKTDTGKIRPHNEDSGGVFFNHSNHMLAIVADGMGGHNAGDIASSLTVKLLQEAWVQTEDIQDATTAESWLENEIISINQYLLSYAKEHPECQGMGTTIVASICTNQFVTTASIGDSRGYILTEETLKQITEDHSLVNELVKTGQISKEDAEHHPRKNVLLKALGTEEVIKPDIRTLLIEEGDTLLICSDGLSNKITEEMMQNILTTETPLDAKADEFISLANDLGGEDNISVLLIHYSDTTENESGCEEC